MRRAEAHTLVTRAIADVCIEHVNGPTQIRVSEEVEGAEHREMRQLVLHGAPQPRPKYEVLVSPQVWRVLVADFRRTVMENRAWYASKGEPLDGEEAPDAVEKLAKREGWKYQGYSVIPEAS